LQAYFEELARLAAETDYDILAHFDVVRRAAYHSFGTKTPDYTPHRETIQCILRTLVERGKGLEINTCTYRRWRGDPGPMLQVLRWYRELGGEIITVGSDAHHVVSIGSCFDVALEMAQAAGFTRLAQFERRQISWLEL
jgi:histidinol-phosphatase (PHP family)